jgi:diacylglycerol kinase (ATP)
LAAVLLPASWWLGRNWLEIALLTIVVLLVLIVELLNSAIEATVDRMSLDVHPLAKKAKDIGSASVFLSLTLCGGVWIAALWYRWSSG